MRAAVCRELGPPEVLVVEERDDLVAGPGQAVVDVHAAGLNYVDALFVAGQYQIKPPLPFVPGSEVAGVVRSVGDGVDAVAAGERVLCMPGLGGFASQVVVGAASLARVPDSMSFGQASTFVQSYCTALFALRDRARLASGETVLVLGAGGGVGLAAIDVARALGAEAIAVASTEAKRQAAAQMGASTLLDPAADDVKARAREVGVDVVVDPVGAELAEPALRALGWLGRYLVIGFAGGAIPKLPANQILLNNRTVVGVDWGAWSMRNPDAQGGLLAEALALVDAGRLHPVEPTTYPLESVADALGDLLGRRVTGKVALTPRAVSGPRPA